jgi:flavin-dependent dehydrogenase
MKLETEVCVIGGGPAGSTISMSLARLGHEVLLLEKSDFPRRHVGESFSPGILSLLDALGIRERVESTQFITTTPVVRWSGESAESLHHAPGLLVDRGQFDLMLLTAARDAGVKIVQPAQAANPSLDQTRDWSIPARGNVGSLLIKARFLVDASGRSFLLKGRRRRTSVPTLALSGYWQNTTYARTQTIVEAGPGEWYWGGPSGRDLFNAIVFIDPRRCLEKTGSIEDLYLRLLQKSSLLRDCLRGTLATDVHACSSSSFYDAECVDQNFIKVGEASFAIDPLSSQGVQVAIQSAAHGAIVVHTLLKKPEYSKAALEFYRARQIETVARVANTASDFYAEQRSFGAQPFWAKRSQKLMREAPRSNKRNSGTIPADRQLRFAETLRLHDVPVIDGNIIRYKAALDGSSLSRPVAFIGGFEVETLFSSLKYGFSVPDLIQSWAKRMTSAQSLEILQWLWSQDLIEV